MDLLLHRAAAFFVLAFEVLACLASAVLLIVLAAGPLYAASLPFAPQPWHWAMAFIIACAIAVAASWVKGVFDKRLPARIGGDPRHAHISGWTFIWIVLATAVVIMLATWAAKSDANRATINNEWGEAILFALAAAFIAAALAPTLGVADFAAGAISLVGRLLQPVGRALSILDSILVFAVAGAAGATQRLLLVRYVMLFATFGACAAMGYWLPAPWGLLPLAWGFLVAIAISRRWAWVETDRELAMLNRRFVGDHLRIGFSQDLRDETLFSFMAVLFLVPLALRQLQIAALHAGFDLFAVDLDGAENLRTWIAFFGTELAKAVPFVDWAEVYNVGGADDGIIRSPASQHFVFVTRILVDLLFLAVLLQALSISARNASQRGLFYERQLDRLDPFLEPREFRKLLRRDGAGKLAADPERLAAFPVYDPIRLSELAGDDRNKALRMAANAVRLQQGGANVAEFQQELSRRIKSPQRDAAAILEVIRAIRASTPERDIAELEQLRCELDGAAKMIPVRMELVRMIAEAPDSPERTQALYGALETARDSLGPARLAALAALGEAADRGDASALEALRSAAVSTALSGAERRSARVLLRRFEQRDAAPRAVAVSAAAAAPPLVLAAADEVAASEHASPAGAEHHDESVHSGNEAPTVAGRAVMDEAAASPSERARRTSLPAEMGGAIAVVMLLIGAAAILLWQTPQLRPWRHAETASARVAIPPPSDAPPATATTPAPIVEPAPQSPAPHQATLGVAPNITAERCPTDSGGASVTVRPGDTLSAIALACYGDANAWPALARCNSFLENRNRGDVSPLRGGDLLYVGDQLVFPTPDGQCRG